MIGGIDVNNQFGAYIILRRYLTMNTRRSSVGGIVFLFILFCLYRFGVGWFSYDDYLQTSYANCLQAEKFRQTLENFGSNQPNSKTIEEIAFPGTKFCSCMSDRRNLHISRFDVAVTIGSYKKINLLNVEDSMKYEAQFCRNLEK